MTETTEPQRRRRRTTFTDKTIADLKHGRKRYAEPVPLVPGLYVRIPALGSTAPKTFTVVGRNDLNRQVWFSLGPVSIGIEAAAKLAPVVRERLARGLPPVEPPTPAQDSVRSVCDNWLRRYIQPRRLRTAADIGRLVERYINAHLGDQPFTSLRKSHVAEWLDVIEDRHGGRTADRCAGILRQVCTWYAQRAPDDYVVPFILVRGGTKRDANGGPRDRVLSDGEVKALWDACPSEGSFGNFCKFALLTGQRKQCILDARFSDIDARSGLWTVRDAKADLAKGKGTIRAVMLPKLALDILKTQPRFTHSDLVFASPSGRGAIANFTRCMRRLRQRSGVDFRVHDLRRTLRTTLSRVGVSNDIAELCIGHVRPAIEKTYDLHPFTEQKSAALSQAADLIAEIVGIPTADKVVRIKSGRRRR
jgi:integrase